MLTPGPWIADPTETGWVIVGGPTATNDVVWTEDMTEEDATLLAASWDLKNAVVAALDFVVEYIIATQKTGVLPGFPAPYAVESTLRDAIEKAGGF